MYNLRSRFIVGFMIMLAVCSVSPLNAATHPVATPFYNITTSSPTPFGQPTVFTASVSDGTPAFFVWKFGDGTPDGDTAQVTHTYARPGIYDASVTIYQEVGVAQAFLKIVIVGGNITSVYLPVVQR